MSRRNLFRIGAAAVPALFLVGGASRALAATPAPAAAATATDTAATAAAIPPAAEFVYFC